MFGKFKLIDWIRINNRIFWESLPITLGDSLYLKGSPKSTDLEWKNIFIYLINLPFYKATDFKLNFNIFKVKWLQIKNIGFYTLSMRMLAQDLWKASILKCFYYGNRFMVFSLQFKWQELLTIVAIARIYEYYGAAEPVGSESPGIIKFMWVSVFKYQQGC